MIARLVGLRGVGANDAVLLVRDVPGPAEAPSLAEEEADRANP